MTVLSIFISSISVHDNQYYYQGDGTGEFEKIAESIDNQKLLYSYRDYLENQLSYVEDICRGYNI